MSLTAEPRVDLQNPASDRSSVGQWACIGVAALAMVATLPGRTHGLGLVTEPLLKDLQLDRVHYGAINFWATLIGAAFCVPWGWMTDRFGVRLVLAGTLASLGAVVIAMSRMAGDSIINLPLFGPVVFDLFVLVLLTRGLGQSGLSVVSLALMGKAAGRRPGLRVGVYSFLVAMFFFAAGRAAKYALEVWEVDWRTLWAAIGCGVLLCLPFVALIPSSSLRGEGPERDASVTHGATLGQALRTPLFWVFGLSMSFYLLAAAGVSLFNQAILDERGFDQRVFLTIVAYSPLVGLASNLLTGWLATRWPLGRLLAVAMFALAAALSALPLVTTLFQVYAYAATFAAAGGMVTVIFFAVWGKAFGLRHLGKIQGAAQLLTVLASALGPLLLAMGHEATGSYMPRLQTLAAGAVVLGVAAWVVPWPKEVSE
jgi:MFS family permease